MAIRTAFEPAILLRRDEVMRAKGLSSWPRFILDVETIFDKIIKGLRPILRFGQSLGRMSLDGVDSSERVLMRIRWLALSKLNCSNSQCPDVSLLVVDGMGKNLRAHPIRTAESLKLRLSEIALIDNGDSKVCDFDHTLLVEQIASFNVSVHDIALVEEAQSFDNLLHDCCDLLFGVGSLSHLHDISERVPLAVLKQDPHLPCEYLNSQTLDDVQVTA